MTNNDTCTHNIRGAPNSNVSNQTCLTDGAIQHALVLIVRLAGLTLIKIIHLHMKVKELLIQVLV